MDFEDTYFEDILDDVGTYGKFQKILVFGYLIPSSIAVPWFNLNILFMLSVPDHWCKVPALDNSNLSIPDIHHLVRPMTPEGPSKCEIYDVNYTTILDSLPDHDNNWTMAVTDLQKGWTKKKECTDGWDYDRSAYDSTASTKWDLVCKHNDYPSLTLTLGNIGSIVGTPVYGALSDKIGRRITFFMTLAVTLVSGIASTLVHSFTLFVILRMINGSLMPSVFQIPYIIVVELVGPTMRTRMNGIGNSSWTVGLCILPLFAYLCRHWITLGVSTTSVTLLFFLYWWVLPESPRWLISQERYEEATAILRRISKINGKSTHLGDQLMIKLQKMKKAMDSEKKRDSSYSPKVFFIYPQLRKKFLIITLCWFTNCASYYGLHINVPNLEGNEFLNFFLLSVSEFPGYLISWVMMERIGRRWSAVVLFIFTGLACLLPVFLPPDMSEVAVAASLMGKLGSAASFMVVYQQGAELYPTPVRSLGMGLSATMASVATVAIPYLLYLGEYAKYIPFLIIGGLCIFAGVCVSWLPETLNQNLPQNIRDAEAFGQNQKFFSCKIKRKASISAYRQDGEGAEEVEERITCV